MEFVPGVSSLSYFCARLGKSWQNVHPVSSHGRDCDVVAYIRSFRSCFILLGGAGSVPDLCRQLVSSGMSGVTLWAGENFSYEDERIAWEMTPAELLMEDERLPFGSLACVLVENTEAAEGQLYPQSGPRDEDFIRGQVPMTKRRYGGYHWISCVSALRPCVMISGPAPAPWRWRWVWRYAGGAAAARCMPLSGTGKPCS